jgi:transposase
MTASSLEIVHPTAGGIDIGSENVFVSVDGIQVRSFSTDTASYRLLLAYLQTEGVTTVAMEATGVYWIGLYDILEAGGMEMYVVNGAHARNLPGRKSDVQDCQWLARLHRHGLLRASFIPDEEFRQLRTFTRLRDDYIGMAGTHIQHMQKALVMMNIKIHQVLSQITGASGLRMLEAIIAGERDAGRLLALCESTVQRRKREPLLAALEGNYRPEYVFLLEQAVGCWKFYLEQIRNCERKIEEQLRAMTEHLPPPSPPSAPKPTRHHEPEIEDLHGLLMRLTEGEDPSAITGIADQTTMRVLAEVGSNLQAWPTAKHFVAWCGLAPKRQQSGRWVKRVRISTSTRVGQLFRTAAQSLAGSKHSALGQFYRKVKARKGPKIAMKALARKIAILFYNVLRHGMEYVEVGVRRYEEQCQQTLERHVQRLAKRLNLKLMPIDPQTT